MAPNVFDLLRNGILHFVFRFSPLSEIMLLKTTFSEGGTYRDNFAEFNLLKSSKCRNQEKSLA